MNGPAPRATQLLQAVHSRPGLTRAEAARLLRAGSGTVATLVSRLVEDRLLAERDAAPTRTRGRPTTVLTPHPDGPLVAVALVSHRGWRVRLVDLVGDVVAEVDGSTGTEPDGTAVVHAVRDAVDALAARHPHRVRAAGLAVPGPVRDGRRVRATLLGWEEQDLPATWADGGGGVPLLLLANDATLAAVGEARRGAAREARTHLHLFLEIGMGGGVTERGDPLDGDSGAAGEFGHLPFGPADLVCPCGARGCWGKTLDGQDLARRLGDEPPADPLAYSERVLDRAAAGDARAADAVGEQAASLGRGAAGLVNALDPSLVTLGGLAARLLVAAPGVVDDAYRRGLMADRRESPPSLVPGALGDDAALVGAADRVWDVLWSRL